MVVSGTVFHHEQFVFKNGEIGNKLLVLLNTPNKNDPYLFVKTTSQRKGKPIKKGCLENLKLFFVPAITASFPDPTWIQLYDIYEFLYEEVEKDKRFKIISHLESKLFNEIIDCLFISCPDDILPRHEKILRPPLQKSIQQLAEKYKKRH